MSKATLHNEEDIERKGIKVGDTVVVRRQGDVIPAVVAVVESVRTGEEKSFIFPTECPLCSSKVYKDQAVWRCPNNNCPGQIEERIKHFVSKKAADIDGLGAKTD